MKSLKNPDRAIHYLDMALEAYREHPDRLGAARVHANLATLLLEQTRLNEAQQHLENASNIYRAVDGEQSLAFGLNELRLAGLLERVGDLAAAKTHRRAGADAVAQASLHFLGKIPLIGALIRLFSKAKGQPTAGTVDSGGAKTERGIGTAARKTSSGGAISPKLGRPAAKRTLKKTPVKKAVKSAAKKTTKKATKKITKKTAKKTAKKTVAKKATAKRKGRRAPK